MVGYTLNDVKKRLKKRNLKKYLKAGTVSPPTSEEKVQLQISHRGISLGFLVALTESFELQNLDTATVVKQFIAPVTDDIEPSRFSELGCFRQYFGEADTFISHCWKGKWGDLVAACLDGGYYLSRIVWIDIFAVTQHPNMKALQDDLNALQSVIAGVRQGTTLVWNPRLQIDSDSNPVLRAWCLYEIHTTVLKENALVIKMGEQASVNSQGYKYNVSSSNSNSRTNKSNGSHNASENKGFDFIPETDENVVTELVFSIDIRRAKATMPEDLERIHAMIEEQGGLDELNTSVRTAVYNNWRIMQIPAVQYALRGSKTKVTQFLRNFDASASASTGTGTYTYGGDPGGSLLHDLVHGNYCIAAQLAIDCGAAINKQTDKGNTPLMFAAEGGRLTMCNTLIQNGAAVDLQNSKKETALHLAAKYGRVDVVKLLLAAGADTTILDRGDYTPAGLAKLDKMPGCKEVLNLLDPEGFSLVSEEGDYQCLGFDGRALVATLKRMFPQN